MEWRKALTRETPAFLAPSSNGICWLIKYNFTFYLMNDTGNSFGSNPASLKGKLQTLEVHSPSFSLKSKTSPTNSTTTKKKFRSSEARKTLLSLSWQWRLLTSRRVYQTSWCVLRKKCTIFYLFRKRHFNFQKAENSRIQQQITSLKGEKTALQQQLLGLQRRIT